MYPTDLDILSLTTPLENAGVSTMTLNASTAVASTTTLAPTPIVSALFSIATIAASSIPTLFGSVSIVNVTFPAAATMVSAASPPDSSDNTGECQLLGPFAVLVQAALGCLALLSLVYKRWRERPQRPVKVWAFDASKQVFGSVLLHLANLFMSMFSTGQLEQTLAKVAADAIRNGSEPEGYQPNPCSFYLLNLAIDTTIGIPILIIILRVLTVGASYTAMANPPESIQSGNYGQPPKATWWLKQSLIYFIGLLGMKACVFLVFELCPWIIRVGDWALRWTEGNEALQIAFVMLIFPLIMNALQYYIIDTFIKKRVTTGEDDNDGQGDEHGEEETLLPEDDQNIGGETSADEVKSKSRVNVRKSRRIKSYDPDNDGEIPGTPATGESSSSSPRTGNQEPMPKTLPATGGP